MYTQRINRADPEKQFCAVLSAYATASLTSGQAVILAGNGTNDGIAVTQPTTTKAALFAGIVRGTIANGDYGAVQCFGYNTDALVSGGTDVAVGDKLSVKTGVFNLIKAAGTLVAGESGVCIALQAFTTGTAAAKKVWLKNM